MPLDTDLDADLDAVLAATLVGPVFREPVGAVSEPCEPVLAVPDRFEPVFAAAVPPEPVFAAAVPAEAGPFEPDLGDPEAEVDGARVVAEEVLLRLEPVEPVLFEGDDSSARF